MGVNFSHTMAHWSYGGFHDFRTRLAKAVGIELDLMDGFTEGDDGISWNTLDDPIKLLLNHEDNEGWIFAENCKANAPRLRELVANWSDDDNDKIQALFLAEGMEAAAAKNENIVFL